MKKLFFIFIFIFISYFSNAQKENYNWDFDGRYVVTFNTPDGEPQILMKSTNKWMQGSAVHNLIHSAISDSNGNFLFSTDGAYIYNYVGETKKMYYNDPQEGLIIKKMGLEEGHHLSGWNSVIVKQPGKENIYYVFVSIIAQYNFDTAYIYSIVDMSKNEGKGEIVSINNLISNPENNPKSALSSALLNVIQHANGKDYWIITHRLPSRRFEVYLLNENGLDTDNPIISSTEMFLTDIPNVESLLIAGDYSGRKMQSNQKGDVLAINCYIEDLKKKSNF